MIVSTSSAVVGRRPRAQPPHYIAPNQPHHTGCTTTRQTARIIPMILLVRAPQGAAAAPAQPHALHADAHKGDRSSLGERKKGNVCVCVCLRVRVRAPGACVMCLDTPLSSFTYQYPSATPHYSARSTHSCATVLAHRLPPSLPMCRCCRCCCCSSGLLAEAQPGRRRGRVPQRRVRSQRLLRTTAGAARGRQLHAAVRERRGDGRGGGHEGALEDWNIPYVSLHITGHGWLNLTREMTTPTPNSAPSLPSLNPRK